MDIITKSILMLILSFLISFFSNLPIAKHSLKIEDEDLLKSSFILSLIDLNKSAVNSLLLLCIYIFKTNNNVELTILLTIILLILIFIMIAGKENYHIKETYKKDKKILIPKWSLIIYILTIFIQSLVLLYQKENFSLENENHNNFNELNKHYKKP